MDIKSDRHGNKRVHVCNGRINTGAEPVEYAKKLESLEAGELLVNSIDNDGIMAGYDLDVIARVSKAVRIPVIACGGAGKLQDCRAAVDAGASSAAAGSLFVYWGRKRTVLINYSEKGEVDNIFALLYEKE